MKYIIIAVVVVIIIGIIYFLKYRKKDITDSEAQVFINGIVAETEPLMREINLAYWMATTTGDSAAYEEAAKKEIEYNSYFSNPELFKKIDAYRKQKYDDPKINRQLDILYFSSLENQIPPELNEDIVKKEKVLVEKFNTFRATLDGKEVTNNELSEKMKTSLDLEERKKVWESSKQVAPAISAQLIEIVKLRNKAAQEVGYSDYYQLQLAEQDFTVDELFSIMDKLGSETKASFAKLKEEIDTKLANKYGIETADLRPWHYEDPFFQELPKIYEVELDSYFKGKDVVEITRVYFDDIGLNADDIMKRSDLYERPGKEQHAYCTDIDRKGDIRILANVKKDERWMSTMLHETGHAVYDKYLGADLPFLIKEAAHIFITEGIAEMFGALTHHIEWMKRYIGVEDDIAAKLEMTDKASKLIFARWVLLMSNFERSLYANPDQDLNALWWDMVEKYQGIHGPYGRNQPDWAAKIHFTTAPVYYHNYILGEMFATQLVNYIKKNVTGGKYPFNDDPRISGYLIEKVFLPGSSLRWNALVEFATGEPLNPAYFAGYVR